MRARAMLLLALMSLALVSCSDAGTAPAPAASTPSVTPATSTGASGDASTARGALIRGDVVVVAAGDIACASPPGTSRTSCQYDDTANLVDGRQIDRVLTLGDNQYEVGALANYRRYFDPTWGVAAGRISPVPGNHDYADDPSSTPTGYFRYFGRSVRGPDGLGYYSYDVGSCPDAPCWHMIALSSEICFANGGCTASSDPVGPGQRQYAWLRADLAEHPDSSYPCTIAYWHHPLFSDSTGSGATSVTRPLWRLLAHANADVVLNGHSHNYERWAPQTPGGRADPNGIREFIVGTGGASHYALENGSAPDNLDAAQDDAFGVLRLVLEQDRYRWQWVSAAGQPSFSDRGIGRCH